MSRNDIRQAAPDLVGRAGHCLLEHSSASSRRLRSSWQGIPHAPFKGAGADLSDRRWPVSKARRSTERVLRRGALAERSANPLLIHPFALGVFREQPPERTVLAFHPANVQTAILVESDLNAKRSPVSIAIRLRTRFGHRDLAFARHFRRKHAVALPIRINQKTVMWIASARQLSCGDPVLPPHEAPSGSTRAPGCGLRPPPGMPSV